MFTDMGAEAVVELLVAALAHQVQIDVTERGQERVRIVERELAAGAVIDLELVFQRQLCALDLALEDPRGMDLRELHGLALARLHRDGLRGGTQRADDDAVVAVGVGAEDRVRFGVLALGERVELGFGDGHSDSRSRAMPATGIGSQSGRLSSSYCSS